LLLELNLNLFLFRFYSGMFFNLFRRIEAILNPVLIIAFLGKDLPEY
jgi:hypothetical protein